MLQSNFLKALNSKNISFGFSFLCFFCSSATLETINIWNASISTIYISPFFVDFVCGWLPQMKDDVAIPDMNRKFLFDFSTIMLAWRLNSLKLLLLVWVCFFQSTFLAWRRSCFDSFFLLWLTHEIYNEITRKERRSRKASSTHFSQWRKGNQWD